MISLLRLRLNILILRNVPSPTSRCNFLSPIEHSPCNTADSTESRPRPCMLCTTIEQINISTIMLYLLQFHFILVHKNSHYNTEETWLWELGNPKTKYCFQLQSHVVQTPDPISGVARGGAQGAGAPPSVVDTRLILMYNYWFSLTSAQTSFIH